jgi:hypothetical protein
MCFEKFKLFSTDRMHIFSTYFIIVKVTEIL